VQTIGAIAGKRQVAAPSVSNLRFEPQPCSPSDILIGHSAGEPNIAKRQNQTGSNTSTGWFDAAMTSGESSTVGTSLKLPARHVPIGLVCSMAKGTE